MILRKVHPSKSVEKQMIMCLGYEEKRMGICCSSKKKGKERKPVKIMIKVIMKSSKNQLSCYMTFFGNFSKNGLDQVQTRHGIKQ